MNCCWLDCKLIGDGKTETVWLVCFKNGITVAGCKKLEDNEAGVKGTEFERPVTKPFCEKPEITCRPGATKVSGEKSCAPDNATMAGWPTALDDCVTTGDTTWRTATFWVNCVGEGRRGDEGKIMGVNCVNWIGVTSWVPADVGNTVCRTEGKTFLEVAASGTEDTDFNSVFKWLIWGAKTLLAPLVDRRLVAASFFCTGVLSVVAVITELDTNDGNNCTKVFSSDTLADFTLVCCCCESNCCKTSGLIITARKKY